MSFLCTKQSKRKHDFVDITTIQHAPSYGTFCDLEQSKESLVWTYKQAFEAAAGMSYLNNGPFQSTMITKLHQMARRGVLITPNDFVEFSCRTVLAMLKHDWIFQNFSTDEIWNAALSSFKRQTAKLPKPSSSSEQTLEFPVLFQIVNELIRMGHVLYPFHSLEYNENIARTIARDQVVMITKGAGIRDCDVVESQRRFLQKLGINQDLENLDENRDLNVIAQILHLTYSAEQRLQILSTLWHGITVYKKRTHHAICVSTSNKRGHWESGINQIISAYL